MLNFLKTDTNNKSTNMRQKNPFKADLKIIKEKETNLKGLNICEYILWKKVRAPITISLILVM